MAEEGMNGAAEGLPPPPPVPPDFTPAKTELEPVKKKPLRLPMARRGLGSKGQKIQILTNHFKVNVNNVDGHFFHYSVALCYEDGRPVDAKGVGRKVLDRVHETYDTELAGKEFAYDGEKSLFTIGALPRNKLEFTVVLDDVTSNRNNGNSSPVHGSPNEADRKRIRRPYQSKTFKVEISFAAKIPMQAIANALRGQESENSQEALRVLDIILRQHAAKQGCLLVRQSFFHNDPKNFVDVGGGVLGCRGFHSSFRTTQSGLSLNIDVSTTMIIQPGPVVDFLIANQNAKDPFSLDWAKAKRMLKNLRVKTSPTNQEYKITGLSDRPCREQLFTLKQKGKDADGEVQTTEVTVYDYFVNHRNIELRYSADLPCINVGKPKRPTFFPIELCSLVSLQRYTKSLSTFQRSSLVEKSRQKPQERMQVLSHALKINQYDAEPLLRACGVSISSNFTQIEGRVLPPPKLKTGGDDFVPRNGRWNFNNKRLVDPMKIERWAVVNFSARCNVPGLVSDLIKCGKMKGIVVEDPFEVFEESPQVRRAPPLVRVEKMFEQVQSKLPGAPKFLLCLLPERKNCDVYGPWKRKNLAEYGIVTQCIAPTRVNDQYITNVLLKINAKLGGLNSMLTVEHSPAIPMVSKVPTIIIGMDVSHGSPGQSDIPSIAAVVSSRQWPSISRYRASVRTQSPKVEMIDNLFKRVSDTEDEGIMREIWCSYLFHFVMWKVMDVKLLEEDLINTSCQLELSLMQTCKQVMGDYNSRTAEFSSFQRQVIENQKLIWARVKQLSGNAGLDHLEHVLSEWRSTFIDSMETDFPSSAGSLDNSEINIPEEFNVDEGRYGTQGIACPVSVEGDSYLCNRRGSGTPQKGISTDSLHSTENEVLVNEIVHKGCGFEIISEDQDSVTARVKETMEKAFWDGVMQSLNQDNPDFSWVLKLMKEVQDELCEMSLPSWRQEIVETVDIDILSQVARLFCRKLSGCMAMPRSVLNTSSRCIHMSSIMCRLLLMWLICPLTSLTTKVSRRGKSCPMMMWQIRGRIFS